LAIYKILPSPRHAKLSTSISGVGARPISSSIRLDMRMMLLDGVDRVYEDVDGTRG
jgi:hypothetical protein